MARYIVDVHTHSSYSSDSEEELSVMLETARKKGLLFYGVSEHFDYDLGDEAREYRDENGETWIDIDEEAYFHGARHLQEDYEGCLNVLIGAEFGFSDDPAMQKRYLEIWEKYRPDFIVNSIHGNKGWDYWARQPFYKTGANGKKIVLPREEVYREYLASVRASLDVIYPYDIVGHIGYPTRYAPYEDRRITMAEFGEQIDDILRTIIAKGKILELNTSNKGGVSRFLPSDEIIKRYYALSGRKISYGSDAHDRTRVADKFDEATAFLKEVGFTHLTVPCKGEHVEIEL